MSKLAYPYKPRTTNARVAGFAILLYIALGMISSTLVGGAIEAEGVAAKLAGIAEHAADVRVALVLGLVAPFVLMVLSTALYAIARDQDRFVSMIAMTSLFGAAVIEALYL